MPSILIWWQLQGFVCLLKFMAPHTFHESILGSSGLVLRRNHEESLDSFGVWGQDNGSLRWGWLLGETVDKPLVLERWPFNPGATSTNTPPLKLKTSSLYFSVCWHVVPKTGEGSRRKRSSSKVWNGNSRQFLFSGIIKTFCNSCHVRPLKSAQPI